MSSTVASRGSNGGSLADMILSTRTGSSVSTKLETDEKVLARVTDGIYRRPSSALRELVSNAYDADATEVVIQTDRPRFGVITVSDNGHGMSPQALAHMIQHIGGSSKRTDVGASIGVTSPGDRALSPGGRRLIGRIGIGLFSVSQLVHSFQIITKTAGDPWRTVARVRMRTHDDGAAALGPDSDELSGPYEAGKVSIWQIPAEDRSASGTTIVLSGIREHARRTLASSGRWSRVRQGAEPPPAFHVGQLGDDGYIAPSDGKLDSLPWNPDDAPGEAFRKLVDAVWERLRTGESRNPSLDHLFDTYLQTVWDLALSAPLPYVDTNPFEVATDDATLYRFEGTGPNGVERVHNQSLKDGMPFDDVRVVGGAGVPFRVVMDDLELARPLKFRGLPSTSHAITRPLMFGGSLDEDFGTASSATSGGRLRFDAYLMWAPKIAPVEHNGVLIRVHGASGTLFDRSFLDYQIAELTRLRQLTCEIFIHEGFEAALNIDREGFNHSHPHALRLTAWLHTAISRAINEQKSLANTIRRRERSRGEAEHLDSIQEHVALAWESRHGDDDVPRVVWGVPGVRSASAGDIRLDGPSVLGAIVRNDKSTRLRKRRVEAIIQMLAAYDLLDELADEEAAELFASIGRILAEDA